MKQLIPPNPKSLSTPTMTNFVLVVSLKLSKEDFAVFFTLQRLDIITTLENLEPIRLSLQNQVITLEDDNSTDSEKLDSDGSDSDSPLTPKGDKEIRQFLPHGVSSKARTTRLIKSINHLGAHIYNLDPAVETI